MMTEAWSGSENVRARFAGGGKEPSSSCVEYSLGVVYEVEAPTESTAVLEDVAPGKEATGVGSRERFGCSLSRPFGPTSAICTSSFSGGEHSAILTSSSSSPGGGPCGGLTAIEARGKKGSEYRLGCDERRDGQGCNGVPT